MSPAAAQALYWVIEILTWVIIARVLLSWFVRDPENPLVKFLGFFTDPILQPLSRVLTFGGLDLSPIVVLLGLQFLQRVILQAAAG